MDIENPAESQPIQNVYELVPKGESQTLSRRSIVLEWKDINYSVPVPGKPGEMKQILFSLHGAAYPGEILGILGTSGAGSHLQLSYRYLLPKLSYFNKENLLCWTF